MSPGATEADDFAPVDRHPVAGLRVRAEGLIDQPLVVTGLRPLELVEVGELRPGDDGVPEPQGLTALICSYLSAVRAHSDRKSLVQQVAGVRHRWAWLVRTAQRGHSKPNPQCDEHSIDGPNLEFEVLDDVLMTPNAG
jgi:hypothetical protein